MGAWGVKAFENDDALDWLNMLEEDGWKIAVGTVVHLAEKHGDVYVDAGLGFEALAAAEVIAAAFGWPNPSVDQDVIARIEPFVGDLKTVPGLQAVARRAVNKVSGDKSEVFELWSESDAFEEWRAEISGLKQRLGSEAL